MGGFSRFAKSDGGAFALGNTQMSASKDYRLRLLQASAGRFDSRGGHDESLRDTVVDQPAPFRSSALGAARTVAGEISNDMTLVDGAPPGTTLIGIGFPVPRAEHTRVELDPSAFHVAPETVTAIAHAKRDSSPSMEIQRIETRELANRPSAQIAVRPSAQLARTDAGSHELDRHRRARPPQKWEVFEDLGLAPRPITRKAQRLVVSMYRLIGFGILTLIVAVLVGYIGQTAFYFLNRSWVTPVAVSDSDEKVVGLKSQLAQQLNERERLAAELEQAERSIATEQAFQLQFAKAIQADLHGRRVALGRVKQLASTAAATRAEIRATNGDYSASAAAKMGDEYAAGLIDRDTMLAGKFQLAQISSANLSLAERQAQLDQQATELASQTKALDAILSNKSTTAALSYDVLKVARDYEESKLALARELSNRERLKSAMTRQDQIISGIEQSAYLRALENGSTVALVPYANLKNVAAGSSLFACRIDMFICREVGEVVQILPGEVPVQHPKRDSTLRGRMVELQLTDASAAQQDVLFLGGPPLGL